MEGVSLKSLRDRPFELLKELERRGRAVSAQSGQEGQSGREWVGVALRMAGELFLAAREETREVLSVPPGITGVILILWLSNTTLNVMSLMGVVMLVGIAVSNSILIVEFTRHLRSEGMDVREAVATACRVRLRPVLMTSLATIIGLLPMALKLGAGSEAYAPLARAILGGLSVSVLFTVFLVPAAYTLVYGRSR